MRILLDTNVLSEPLRPQPDLGVTAWLHARNEDDTFISVITLAEIRRGVARLQHGRRKTALLGWLDDDLSERFHGRILGVGRVIAQRWGDVMAEAGHRGRNLGIMDGFLAATALDHGLAIATRNVKDFAGLGLEVVDPWLITGADIRSGSSALP